MDSPKLTSKIHQYLNKWRAEGLIDEETHQRLWLREEQGRRPWAMYTVVGLGGLAIALGMLMVVGANWDVIPPWLKLLAYGCLGAGLSFGTLRNFQRGGWIADLLSGFIFAWSLGGFALVSQVYQMGGPMAQAVTIWLILTGPLMLLARSRFLNMIWLLCLAGGWYLWLPLLKLEDDWLTAGWLLTPAWLYLALGHSERLQVRSNALVSVATNLGILGLLIAAHVLSHHFVVHALHEQTETGPGSALMVLLMALGLSVPVIVNWRKHLEPVRFKIQVRLLVSCFVAIFGGYFVGLLFDSNSAHIDFDDWPLIRFLSIGAYVFFWMSVASWSMYIGSIWLNTIAVLAIACRLLLIFVTTFSSLLGTGLIFILSGVCAIGITVMLYRRHRNLRTTQERDS